MNRARIENCRARIERDLRGNILPFWSAHAIDRAGGFVGSLANDLSADPTAERGALLTSRILWTFAAAYGRYRDPVCLAVAERAHDDLIRRFGDRRSGGFFWARSADGGSVRDRKQGYGQAFAIYALSEYHAATGKKEPLGEAVELHRLLESRARDAEHGGYLEAFGRDWEPIADMRLSAVDLNEPKSQNTHLHMLEAYTRLLELWPDAGLRRSLAGLIELMLSRIVDPRSGHLGLFFARDWTLRSDRISYGHDIEASWLLTRAAEAAGDAALIERTRSLAVKIAQVTLAEGADSDGALFNEGGPEGISNSDKEWWPQAEAVVGFLNAYEIEDREEFLEAALRSWEFIERRLVDRVWGEWFRGVTRDGRVLADQLKVSFWKCPYHNGRMGLEAVARLDRIAARLSP